MDTKYFKSKFGRIDMFEKWDAVIQALDVNVYDIIVPCERAVILGGFWENPSVFADIETFVFYIKMTDRTYRAHTHNIHVDILRLYYGEMFDISHMAPDQAAEYIKGILADDSK